MQTVGVRELKNKLSEYLRRVRLGERVLVIDRGEVVAELLPPGQGQVDWARIVVSAACVSAWARVRGFFELPQDIGKGAGSLQMERPPLRLRWPNLLQPAGGLDCDRCRGSPESCHPYSTTATLSASPRRSL